MGICQWLDTYIGCIHTLLDLIYTQTCVNIEVYTYGYSLGGVDTYVWVFT